MIHQITDSSGDTEDQTALPASPAVRYSAIGILGALMLVLPATGSAQPSADAPPQGTNGGSKTGVIEHFEDISARLRQRCATTDLGVIEDLAGQPINQFGNWSDW